MKVIIDPEDDILYMSFYLKGLQELYGHGRMEYRRQAFDDLPPEARFSHTVRFILRDGLSERRYVIDTTDPCSVNETLYQWCDVYGSVNANFAQTPPELHGKLVALCPSFAIRHTSYPRAAMQAIRETISTRGNRHKQLGRWKRLLQRPTLEAYRPCPSRENYIFHLSTLWQSDQWNRNDEGVNLRRAEFIRACRELEPTVVFEGGLVSSRTDTGAEQFSDCLSRRHSGEACQRLTRESAIVFNTPAYWNCHGWKLGEYMAMGKAMLSTPLQNDLPAPLVNGEHYHLAEQSDKESLKENILQMMKDPQYRRHLATNLHQYWEQYGTPEASLRLMGLTR